MNTISIEEAQVKLAELIDHLAAGEILVITRNQKPVARLTVEGTASRRPRQLGSAKMKTEPRAVDSTGDVR